jgi:hypothetical protein
VFDPRLIAKYCPDGPDMKIMCVPSVAFGPIEMVNVMDVPLDPTDKFEVVIFVSIVALLDKKLIDVTPLKLLPDNVRV